jgi:cob(I)alamin adenosyltransferase
MPKFYTRNGDDGTTGYLGAGRLPKNHPRIETVGAVDEATAALGLARSLCQAPATGALLLAVQRDFYYLMGEIAAGPENAARFRQIDSTRLAWLEEQLQAVGSQVTPPGEFIVPGDSPAGAALALARTVVRRAERRAAALHFSGELENPALLAYLNRCSSLCFVLELLENQAFGKTAPTLMKG